MGKLAAAIGFVLVGIASGGAQTLTNAALSGNFFFRHVSLAMDSTGDLTDPRSLIGTLTFDGAGNYTYTGQQVVGNNASTVASGKGTYTVDPAGFVAIDNPQRTGVKINARVGPEALLGSSTESGDNTFDLFAAIPAPASAGNAALNGPYWVGTLEYPGGSLANARSAIFSMTGTGGALNTITVNGHSAAVASGAPQNQQITGASYVMNTDGTGSANFGSGSTLVSGSKALYLSADGNLIIGGSTSTGSHDFLIGVKAVASATAASWSGSFWAASLRTDAAENPAVFSYAGSVHANGSQGLTWTQRIEALAAGASDFTAAATYTLNADASGTSGLNSIGLGAAGRAFVSIALSSSDPNAYELDFGARMADLSGTGVFLNPQGVFNAASSAPAGNPISPGEFIALYGTGLAGTTKTATPPYPTAPFNGVSVLINNKPAPIYFVSPGQINALVPYATTGPTATIVVQNGTATSNSVTVPVAATAPGIYSLSQSGVGPGAILDTNYNVVSASNPAHAGQTVQIFLTGMGAVSPAIADGTAGSTNPSSLSTAVSPVTAFIEGEQCVVSYNGLAPGFPGLYQINVTLPPLLPGTGPVPLALSTGNAYHDQVTIAVQ
ncbi:MAG TPA: IPT/TIG domain-containing protein [Bryobacteraceae bacterium]|nr:IPT/TIG domain-containing protein [Bryobacteraceae bacterium]